MGVNQADVVTGEMAFELAQKIRAWLYYLKDPRQRWDSRAKA